MTAKRAILFLAVSSGAQAEDDKESLPEQESRLRDMAAREGWDVIDTILVPGFSRVFYNYPEFAQAAAADGIPAPLRLLEHWRKRDFDVLACMDGSRFGREQSIFAEVVSRTIDSGAMIYTVKDSYITKSNYRMYVSMAGYGAAGEIDELMRRKAFGMRGRAMKGLPTSPKLVPFLRYVLDDKGVQLRVVVNEDLRRLWDDLAEVVLEGTPWRSVEDVLYERYGHARNGKRWRTHAMYEFMLNPAWWGHDALNHQFKDGQRMKRSQPWVWDDSVPPPDGVQVFRHAHPAVYAGDTAARVQAELWRRHTVIQGHANPNAYRFTGLLVCDECQRTLVATKKPANRWVGWRCMTRYDIHKSGRTCTQRRTVNDDSVQAFLNDALSAALEDSTPLFDSEPAHVPSANVLAQLDAEIAAATAERRVMIREQARAPQASQAGYREEIDALSEQLAILEQRREQVAYTVLETQQQRADTQAALEDVAVLGLTAFWQQPPQTVNAALHRALGATRLVVRDGQIVGAIRVERRRGTY